MTREEQIEKAEIKYFDGTRFDGCDYVGEAAKTAAFIAGANWADENPKEGLVSVDKVCELLKKHIIIHGFEDVKIEWIEQFRKVMEE